MNTTTFFQAATAQDISPTTTSEGSAHVEAIKELAEFELAYVGGGTANVIFQ